MNNGGWYDPAENKWTALPTEGAPTGRSLHMAVWTGTEMIVWGGFDYRAAPLNDGACYSPKTRTWINNSARRHGDYLELKKTGSLYGIRNVYPQMVGDDEWFTIEIRVLGKNVQVRVNGLLVVDYNEPADPGRKRLGAGTFALQGHDPDSRVCFRLEDDP